MRVAARSLIPGLVGAAIVAGALSASAQGGAPDAASRLVAAFLESAKGTLRSARDLPTLEGRLRPLLAELDAELGALPSPPERRRARDRAREALASGLAALLPGPEARQPVDDLLAEAFRLHRNRRLASLETSLICWCEDEDWTRTLAGCPDGCANEQKQLIAAWLDEGATNDEVIRRMVEHPKGGPRVRAAPEARGVSWIGYLAPAAIFCVALVVVVLFLRRAMRRRTETASAPEVGADDLVGEQIERELREMER